MQGAGPGSDALHADLVLLRAGDGRPGPQAEARHGDGARRQMPLADGWAGQQGRKVPSQLFLILDAPELVPVVHTAGTLLIRTRGSRGGSGGGNGG